MPPTSTSGIQESGVRLGRINRVLCSLVRFDDTRQTDCRQRHLRRQGSYPIGFEPLPILFGPTMERDYVNLEDAWARIRPQLGASATRPTYGLVHS